MQRARRFLARFLWETDGNILPMAAMGMIVAAIIVGSAVDLSRAYRAKSRLQAACDAAVLAGRRTVTTKGFDAAAEDAADDYFATNFYDDRFQTRSPSFLPTADDKGNTVAGKASTVLATVRSEEPTFELQSL